MFKCKINISIWSVLEKKQIRITTAEKNGKKKSLRKRGNAWSRDTHHQGF